jgi:hypothetical protein
MKIMDAQTLNTINVLTTRRNLAVRRLAALAETGSGEISKQLRTFIAGVDSRAKALGVRLVAMPGRPGAVIADVFLPIVAD